MGKALYRTYRSKSLDEIVGQEHITSTLKRALEQERISHAYLFTGPRGVGKTSVARILAHAINDLPYTDDTQHIDIIEIDAASNRRIDEIRDLRDKIVIAPAIAKYKVYIIDEVHMLTKEAFNALLKTLEEPPAHAVFILATTDAHKLPATIISRTQRFTFKPVPVDEVVQHLRHIAKQEKIQIDDDALALLAEHGEGSFRDSISLLDQVRSHAQPVHIRDVQALLGVPPAEAIDSLADSLWKQSASELALQLESLHMQGYQAASIANELGQRLRQGVLTGNGDTERQLELLSDLLQVPTAFEPERFLEIALLRTAPTTQADSPAVNSPEPATPKPAPEPSPVPPPEPPAEDEPEPVAKMESAPAPKASVTATAVFDEALWPEVLKALKKRHNTLYGVVRMAEPSFDNTELTLLFAFAFHQKRISEPSSRQLLSDIIHELTGQAVTITCQVKPASKLKTATSKAPAVAKTEVEAPLSTVSNIFGGGELLES